MNNPNDGTQLIKIEAPYVDKGQVTCPTGLVVAGISFYLKGNRIAPQLWCQKPDGSSGLWVQNESMDEDYFSWTNYVDAGYVAVPSGATMTAFSLFVLGNRVAPSIGWYSPVTGKMGISQNSEHSSYYLTTQEQSLAPIMTGGTQSIASIAIAKDGIPYMVPIITVD